MQDAVKVIAQAQGFGALFLIPWPEAALHAAPHAPESSGWREKGGDKGEHHFSYNVSHVSHCQGASSIG